MSQLIKNYVSNGTSAYLSSFGSSYLVSREGTGSVIEEPREENTTFRVGDRLFITTPTYYSYQGILSFDTSIPAGEILVGAELRIYLVGWDALGGVGLSLEMRGFSHTTQLPDYGPSAMVPASQQGNLPLLATIVSPTNGLGGHRIINSSSLAAYINRTGWTSFIFNTEINRLGTTWSAGVPGVTTNRYSTIATDSATEDNRPTLTLYTRKATPTNKVVFNRRTGTTSANDQRAINYLTQCGMAVIVIDEADVPTYDFSDTDLLVIGDPNMGSTAHTQAGSLFRSGVPIIAMCRHTSRNTLGMSTSSTTSAPSYTAPLTVVNNHPIISNLDFVAQIGDTIEMVEAQTSHRIWELTAGSTPIITVGASSGGLVVERIVNGYNCFHFGIVNFTNEDRVAPLFWSILKYLGLPVLPSYPQPPPIPLTNKVVFNRRFAVNQNYDQQIIDYMTNLGLNVTVLDDASVLTHDFSDTNTLVVGAPGTDFPATHVSMNKIGVIRRNIISLCRRTSRDLKMASDSNSGARSRFTVVDVSNPIVQQLGLNNLDTVTLRGPDTDPIEEIVHIISSLSIGTTLVMRALNGEAGLAVRYSNHFRMNYIHFGCHYFDRPQGSNALLWSTLKSLGLPITDPISTPVEPVSGLEFQKSGTVGYQVLTLGRQFSDIIRHGVCVELGEVTPTIASVLKIEYGTIAPTPGILSTRFFTTHLNLSPGTLYTCRAYTETTGGVINYSTEVIIITYPLSLPSLTSFGVPTWDSHFAAFYIEDAGDNIIIEAGFCYGDNPDPTISNAKFVVFTNVNVEVPYINSNSIWPLRLAEYNLPHNFGNKYIRGYAINSQGVAYTSRSIRIFLPSTPLFGAGTLADPYWITTLEHLRVAASRSDYHFKVMNDIDGGYVNFEPLYSNSYLSVSANRSLFPNLTIDINQTIYRAGSLDGNGKTISNLNINHPGRNHVGLFESLEGRYDTERYKVSNLHLNNISVIGGENVGGFAGTIHTCELDNCSVKGSIVGNRSVGGLISDAFSNCLITNCNVSGSVTGTQYVGGFYGGAQGYSFDIKGGSFTGDVIIRPQAGHSIGYVGGFGGDLTTHYSNRFIEKSWCVAKIHFTGGGTTASRVGGFSGFSGDLIENCFSRTTITFDSSYITIQRLGGFIGEIENNTIRLNYCSTLITVINGLAVISNRGTLYGVATPSSNNSSNYYNSTLANPSGTVQGIGLTNLQMKDPSNFALLNFDSIWTIHPIRNYGFPFLLGTNSLISLIPVEGPPSPIIIISVSSGKISNNTGRSVCTVTFRVSEDIISWEARAEGSGVGQGSLVGSGP